MGAIVKVSTLCILGKIVNKAKRSSKPATSVVLAHTWDCFVLSATAPGRVTQLMKKKNINLIIQGAFLR